MSERIGHAAHDCRRDELPTFMGYSSWEKYSDGDIVGCSCGRVWLVTDGRFCRYRELKGRKLRRAIEAGLIHTEEET